MKKFFVDLFSPKGKLNRIEFLVNYIILKVLFFITSIFGNYITFRFDGTIPAIRFLAFILLIVFICIETIIIFNYKKRLFSICNNLVLSITLALLFTLGTDFLPLALPDMLFGLAIINIVIIPLILSTIPARK